MRFSEVRVKSLICGFQFFWLLLHNSQRKPRKNKYVNGNAFR